MYDKLYKYKPTEDLLHDVGDDPEMFKESQMEPNTFIDVSTDASTTGADTSTASGTSATTSVSTGGGY